MGPIMDAVPGTPGDTHELHQHIISTEELLCDQLAARDGSQELDLDYCYSLLNMFIEPPPAALDPDIEMGAGSGTEFRCHLCRKTFKQKSSLVRHVKKCTLEPKLSVRQKACRHCTVAKARCDLQRPSCSRCSSRGASCVYARTPAQSKAATERPVRDVIVASNTVTMGTPTSLDFGSVMQGAGGGGGDHLTTDPAYLNAAATMPDFPGLAMATAGNGSAMTTPDFFPHHDMSASDDMMTPPDTTSSAGGSLDDLENLPLVPLMDLANARFDEDGNGNDDDKTHAAAPSSSSPPATEVEVESWLLALAARPLVPDAPELVRHSSQTVLRVFRSWPRMLARGIQLPPVVHFLQFRGGAPRPLANCVTLCKMWAGQAGGDSARIVADAVGAEVGSILDKYHTYDAPTLLAATQSIVILVLMLLFPSNRQSSISVVPLPVFAQLQQMAYHVLSTGTTLQEEEQNAYRARGGRGQRCHMLPPPSWCVWAHIEAKRRAVQAVYFLYWAYSVYHGSRHFNCLELGRMLAPGPRFLWQATDEATWRGLYIKWLAQWSEEGGGGTPGLLQAEFFLVQRGPVMDRRVEMWLDDADELGIMMMSMVNASQRDLSQIPGPVDNSIG